MLLNLESILAGWSRDQTVGESGALRSFFWFFAHCPFSFKKRENMKLSWYSSSFSSFDNICFKSISHIQEEKHKSKKFIFRRLIVPRPWGTLSHTWGTLFRWLLSHSICLDMSFYRKQGLFILITKCIIRSPSHTPNRSHNISKGLKKCEKLAQL